MSVGTVLSSPSGTGRLLAVLPVTVPVLLSAGLFAVSVIIKAYVNTSMFINIMYSLISSLYVTIVRILNTHGDYPAAAQTAEEQLCPV